MAEIPNDPEMVSRRARTMSNRFAFSLNPHDIYVDVDEFLCHPIEIDLRGDIPQIYGVSCEYLEKGVTIACEGNCSIHQSHDNDLALQEAVESIRNRLGNKFDLNLHAENHHDAYLAAYGDTPKFRLRIDPPAFADYPKKNLEIRLNFDPCDMSGDAAHPGWLAGERVIQVLHIKGPMGYLNRPFALDLGTTATCSAVVTHLTEGWKPVLFLDEDGRLADGQVALTTPTVVYYNAVGDADESDCQIGYAANAVSPDPQNPRHVHSFKRYLSTGKLFPLRLDGGDLVQVSADRVYNDFLKRYVRGIEKSGGKRLARIRATYPPDFPDRALESMQQAYRNLNVASKHDMLFGIDEASAAAVFFAYNRLAKCEHDPDRYMGLYPGPRNMLVFDLGGGTTDMAIVSTRMKVAEGDDPNALYEFSFSVLDSLSLLDVGGNNFTLEVLKAIKARLALAVARYHKGAGNLAEFNTQTGGQALKTLYQRQAEFEKALSGHADPKVVVKTLAELDELAEQVIPTRWKNLAEISMLASRDAQATFSSLWHIAERAKIELCNNKDGRAPAILDELLSETTRRDVARLGLEGAEDVWSEIKLNRAIDLDARIRPLLVDAANACRDLIKDDFGQSRDIHSVQLVGNSCRVPLVREILVNTLQPLIPQFEKLIEHDDTHSKTAVALGACLYEKLNEIRRINRILFKVRPLDRRLKWEIGEWDSQRGVEEGFVPYFRAAVSSVENEPVEINDVEGARSLDLYRRRPGSRKAPEIFCKFDLTKPSPPDPHIVRVPQGKLRLVLRGPSRIVLIRGQSTFHMDRIVPPQRHDRDPFSGLH